MSNIITKGHSVPILDFLQETREAMDQYLALCVPLLKHALQGNWAAAKRILDKDSRLRHAAISRGWPTVLHIAAGSNHVHFVKELLQILDEDDIALQDMKGNTAFSFAAASGNMEIARLLLDKNPFLPVIRCNDRTPIQFAVWRGRCEMARFLYDKTKHVFQDEDWELLFFSCIDTGDFDMALRIARENEELAFARDENGDTALHLLALNQNPLESSCHCSEHQHAIKINPGMKQHVFFKLVKFLWNTILFHANSPRETIEIISEPYQLLVYAAEVGNFGFLSELISSEPSLIWEVDIKSQSIIHIAVSHRQASIFNLIQEIGCFKDIITTYAVEENDTGNNTLLHLAANLATPGQLELVSGAAFQMCLELTWFEEVKKLMPPSFIKLRNSRGLTAQELFTLEHEKLREEAEAWMKRTAKFCMIISTVIATAVFSAAIIIPGGIDDGTNKPNYVDKTSFWVFAISDGTAFISSAIATLIFLSILISRYAEYDFHKSLPLKLISGLITLFISITCMMVSFGSSFFITYYYGLKSVPELISILVTLPMLLYLGLQFSLWSDIIYSTFYCRTLFKPSKSIIYQLD